jgi:hypothetical protein
VPLNTLEDTLLGGVLDRNIQVQSPLNPRDPSSNTFTVFGITMDLSILQPLKAFFLMVSILNKRCSIQFSVKFLQFKNASSPVVFTFG